MSFGVWFFYTACALVGLTIGIHWASTSTRFKWWLVCRSGRRPDRWVSH